MQFLNYIFFIYMYVLPSSKKSPCEMNEYGTGANVPTKDAASIFLIPENFFKKKFENVNLDFFMLKDRA